MPSGLCSSARSLTYIPAGLVSSAPSGQRRFPQSVPTDGAPRSQRWHEARRRRQSVIGQLSRRVSSVGPTAVPGNITQLSPDSDSDSDMDSHYCHSCLAPELLPDPVPPAADHTVVYNHPTAEQQFDQHSRQRNAAGFDGPGALDPRQAWPGSVPHRPVPGAFDDSLSPAPYGSPVGAGAPAQEHVLSLSPSTLLGHPFDQRQAGFNLPMPPGSLSALSPPLYGLENLDAAGNGPSSAASSPLRPWQDSVSSASNPGSGSSGGSYDDFNSPGSFPLSPVQQSPASANDTAARLGAVQQQQLLRAPSSSAVRQLHFPPSSSDKQNARFKSSSPSKTSMYVPAPVHQQVHHIFPAQTALPALALPAVVLPAVVVASRSLPSSATIQVLSQRLSAADVDAIHVVIRRVRELLACTGSDTFAQQSLPVLPCAGDVLLRSITEAREVVSVELTVATVTACNRRLELMLNTPMHCQLYVQDGGLWYAEPHQLTALRSCCIAAQHQTVRRRVRLAHHQRLSCLCALLRRCVACCGG